MIENTFYLGEQYNKLLLLLVEGESYNPTTGEVVVATNFFASSNYLELKSEYLHIPVRFTSSGSRIYYYDENYKYLTSYKLFGANPTEPIKVAKGAKYMTLSFYKAEPNLIRYTQDSIDRLEYVDFIYAVYDVKPVYKTLTKRQSKENGQEFFRESLEGNITLVGEDYLKVYGAPLDTKFILFVYRDKQLYFSDSFTKTTCTFDYGKHTCKVKLAKEDKYSAIMSKYDKKYDLYDIGVPTTKVELTKRPAIQLYIAGSQKVTTTLDGLYWEGDVIEEQLNEYTLDTKYHFVKISGLSEFQFNSINSPKVSLNFSGSFNNTEMSLLSKDKQYKCFLVQVAKKGDAFEGPYSAYEYTTAQEIYSRESRQSYTAAHVFAEDSYVLRIQSTTDGTSWESLQLFHVDNPSFKVLGVGSDINFKNADTGSYDGQAGVVGVNSIFARLICDVESFTNPNGSTVTTYEIPVDDFVQDNRNYKRCYGVNLGEIISTFATSEKPTKYGQDDDGMYFKRPSTAAGYNIIPLDQGMWINSAIWYAFSEYFPQLDERASKKYYLKDAYAIADVIQILLNKIDPQLTHKASSVYSEFLYSATCPVRKDRIYLFLTQKTNVLKGEYDQAAKKAEISLGDVLSMLQKCFKCYFWIEDNKLRVEHISWFLNGGSYDTNNWVVGLDLTKKKDAFNKMYAEYFQSEITYDATKLPSSYTFNYADDQTEAFSGVSFEVNASYVDASEAEEVQVGTFAADIDYMLISPNSFSEEGFALIGATEQSAKYACPVLSQRILLNDGSSYTVRVQNAYLSWLYLLDYYMYDLPALRIVGTPVENLKPIKTSRFMEHKLKLPLPKNFNVQNSIVTKVGEGCVTQVEEDITTGIASITLAYEPR